MVVFILSHLLEDSVAEYIDCCFSIPRNNANLSSDSDDSDNGGDSDDGGSGGAGSSDAGGDDDSSSGDSNVRFRGVFIRINERS